MGGIMIDCKVALQIHGAWYELEIAEAFELYQKLSGMFSIGMFHPATQEEQIDAVKADTLIERLKGR
jgi:hypothetical protein